MAVHASHSSLPYPVKNARFSLLVPYLDADGDPTAPATPDTEISKDNGAAADCAEEASATSGMDGMSLITLTGAETNCSCIALNAKVASGPKATLLILYPRVLPIILTGQASAGGNTSITLAAGAYDLTGCIVRTTGGTGGGGTGGANNQARVITAYNTSTFAATVEPAWETNPDNTTTYDILLTDLACNTPVTRGLRPTTDGRTLAVDASNNASAALANVAHGGVVAVLTLERIVVASTTTNEPAFKLTGNGTAAGLHAAGGGIGVAGIDADIAGSITGSLSGNVGGNVTGNVTGNVAGSVLGAVGSFADTAKAQLQVEAEDALIAHNLDHLVKIAVDTNFATTVHANSVIGHLADNGAGFDRTTDSLEAIRDTVAAGGGGAGSISWPVTVQRSDNSNPIAGASVWVTSDAAGSNVVAGTLTTNGSGVATFLLDAGSWYLWVQAEGYNGTNPTLITVA